MSGGATPAVWTEERELPGVGFRAAVPSVTDRAIQRLSRNVRVARGRP